MALTNDEIKLAETLKQSGKSNTEVFRIIAKRRGTGTQFDPSQPQETSTLDNVAQRGIGVAKGLTETARGTAQLLQSLGQGVVAALDPTKTFDEIRQQTGFQSLSDEQITEMLKSKNELQKQGKIIAFGGEVLAGGGASLIKKGVTKGVDALGSALDRGAETVTSATQTPVMQGIFQKGKELIDRVPRFFDKAKEGAEEAAIKAERIKSSSPVTQEAFKSGLDERFINTVQQADKQTVQAYKEMVDIAESGTAKKGGTLKLTERPEIVAGKAAEEQYKFIDKARKNVGKQIGDAVDVLSKKQKIDVLPATRTLRGVLRENGIQPMVGGQLKFTGKFTPNERAAIQKIYDLATEGGEQLTPRQIYDMDRLFSKLQREARFEGLGDIIVDTAEGSKSIYRLFRDVYSTMLDNISPEMRGLNKQYRQFISLQDDIESTIVKSGKYETTKGVDDAEFAQTNLRRLTSDALSSPDYRAIAEKMDEVARGLGYSGAKPEDLIVFANELRKLFPETIPQTSLSGSIKTGITEIAGKILRAGEPTAEDQQKALKALIEEYLR